MLDALAGPAPLGDPFASLRVPGTCGSGGNPGAGQPGVYNNPVTITGALAQGNYIFCNTVAFSGTTTSIPPITAKARIVTVPPVSAASRRSI